MRGDVGEGVEERDGGKEGGNAEKLDMSAARATEGKAEGEKSESERCIRIPSATPPLGCRG